MDVVNLSLSLSLSLWACTLCLLLQAQYSPRPDAYAGRMICTDIMCLANIIGSEARWPDGGRMHCADMAFSLFLSLSGCE